MSDNYKSDEGVDRKIKRASHAKQEPEAGLHSPAEDKAATKKSNKGMKIALGVIGAIVALCLVGAVAAFTYYKNIENNMKYQGNQEELNQALTIPAVAEDHSFYVLVIGSDSEVSRDAHSDVMALTRVDPDKGQLTLVSIPRDTPYLYDGRIVKLNQVYTNEGDAACIEAVSAVTGVKINHFMRIELSQLRQLVDSLGGIDVDVPYTIPGVVSEGHQHINGTQAIGLTRQRQQYTIDAVSQDAVRQTNIRNIMISIMATILKKPANEIPGYINQLSSMIETDISMQEMLDWAMALSKFDKLTVYSCSGPYEGGLTTVNGSPTEVWLAYEAPEQWALLMAAVDSGQDPSTALASWTSSDGAVTIGTEETLDISGNDNKSENEE